MLYHHPHGEGQLDDETGGLYAAGLPLYIAK